MRIALIGCTGQIGRCLVRALAPGHELALYARRVDFMRGLLDERGIAAPVFDLCEFSAGAFDLIVNAIGDGVPGRIKAAGASILEVTERFDRLCLDHLDRDPSCAYVFLSSGRIYGEAYEAAQAPDPQPLPADRLAGHPYPLAKLQAEQRHRQRPDQRIADIRIFGYVSDEIGLDDDFLVAQVLRALADDGEFVTTTRDLVRDYVGPADLVELIDRLADAGFPNGAYDLVSAAPVTKFALLRALAQEKGLRYAVEGMPRSCPAPATISLHDGARRIAHVPARTSLENVLSAAEAIMARPSRRQSVT